MPAVQGRAAHWIEAAPGEMTQWHRMGKRSRGGGAELGDTFVLNTCENAQCIHIRMLALRWAHAHGSVAFEQLARPVDPRFAHQQRLVAGRLQHHTGQARRYFLKRRRIV